MCKAVKSFSGYYGCDKYNIKGNYLHSFKKLVFPQIEGFNIRSNATFRSQTNVQHHKGLSPFIRIPSLDMVNVFPIDYMHQVLLGVQRRLLNIWVAEAKGRGRLPAQKVTAVSECLTKLAPHTPREFARKPWSLSHLAHYKATEFRSFLLYTGKMVLKDFLSHEKYTHFLCLSVAITILLNTDLVQVYADDAHQLLLYFVQKLGALYGEQHLVYNMHSLLHLADQAKFFGNLNLCSAFDFENHMKVYKRIIRQRKNPLVEIVRRLGELDSLKHYGKTIKSQKVLCKPPDNVYMTVNGDIIEALQVRYHKASEGHVHKMYRCRKYYDKKDFFTEPCPSSVIGIFAVDKRATALCDVPAKAIAKKCFKMVVNGIVVVQTLVHEL